MTTSKETRKKTATTSKKPAKSDFSHNVFINCPFDTRYYPLFHAMVFTIHLLGFRPRCSREEQNSGRVRLDKLIHIICECKFGIHDISRTGLDSKNHLPRFNMPFELGIDIGIREVGSEACKSKNLLILDKAQYRFQKFLSDIGGQDIAAHENKVHQVVTAVRNWLQTATNATDMASGAIIYKHYKRFRRELPKICEASELEMSEMNFLDYSHTAADWVKKNYQKDPESALHKK
jgi:hypothetical protein